MKKVKLLFGKSVETPLLVKMQLFSQNNKKALPDVYGTAMYVKKTNLKINDEIES